MKSITLERHEELLSVGQPGRVIRMLERGEHVFLIAYRQEYEFVWRILAVTEDGVAGTLPIGCLWR